MIMYQNLLRNLYPSLCPSPLRNLLRQNLQPVRFLIVHLLSLKIRDLDVHMYLLEGRIKVKSVVVSHRMATSIVLSTKSMKEKLQRKRKSYLMERNLLFPPQRNHLPRKRLRKLSFANIKS